MAEHMLTDGELRNAYASCTTSHLKALRAVEAEVLAKAHPAYGTPFIEQCRKLDEIHAGCVTEREARRRERAAAEWMVGISGCSDFPKLRRMIDRRYPAPSCDKCGQELP